MGLIRGCKFNMEYIEGISKNVLKKYNATVCNDNTLASQEIVDSQFQNHDPVLTAVSQESFKTQN